MDPLTTLAPPRFLVGLDIGQLSDPTALAIGEREMVLVDGQRLAPRFLVRFLERVPLRTPYPQMVRGVRQRLTALGEPATLLLDATGVGRGVVDLFKEPVTAEQHEAEAAYHPRWRLARVLHPVAITLTGGAQARQVEGRLDEWTVPKRDLIMVLQVALQQGRVQVAKALPDAATLVKEAQQFQWRPTKTGDDAYGAWREGQHDDLLLAVAMLVWWGERYAPVQAPETTQAYAVRTRLPWQGRPRYA